MTLSRTLLAIREAARLLTCVRGNVALIFGLSALPLAVTAGFGVDLWRQNAAITATQNAVDAAVLAAASSDLDEEVALKAVVDRYLAANLRNGELRADYTVNVRYIDNERLKADFEGVTPALFSGLLGLPTLPVRVTATATRGSNDFVEVALVLDNTWSMSASDGTGTSKIAGLKTAATALVNELMVREDGKVRIGVVPYADYVNVGLGNRSAFWLNVPADYSTTSTPAPRVCTQVPVTTTTCTGGVRGTCTRYVDGVAENYACWTTPRNCRTSPVVPARTRESCTGGGSPVTTNYRWFGCVRSRNVGTLRLNDTLPVTPYGGLTQQSQTCLNPILPLSQTRATVLTQINGLIVNVGSYRPETYIPAGMVWGINTLSPDAPLTDGRTYGANVRKIIVLMTDGENTLRYRSSDGAHIAPTAASRASQLAGTDSDVGSLCTYAKTQNMEIYTVGLGVGSSTAVDMLRDCATSAAHAHNATDTTALIATFKRIARSINAVRLID